MDPDAESLPLLQGGGRIYQGSETSIYLSECNGIPRLDEIPQFLPLGSLLEWDLAGDILIHEHPAHLQARLLSELTQPDRLGIGRCLLIIRGDTAIEIQFHDRELHQRKARTTREPTQKSAISLIEPPAVYGSGSPLAAPQAARGCMSP
jgi:hypothetical protein